MSNEISKETPETEAGVSSEDSPIESSAEYTTEQSVETPPNYPNEQSTPQKEFIIPPTRDALRDGDPATEAGDEKDTHKPVLPRAERRMNPYLAGILIGIATVLLYVVTGTGTTLSQGLPPLTTWISSAISGVQNPILPLTPSLLMLAGCFIGGFLFSLVFGGFSLRLERGARCKARTRTLLALFGGVLSGLALRAVPFGAFDAALSGTALLLTGPALFIAGFIISGFILTNLLRRQWND